MQFIRTTPRDKANQALLKRLTTELKAKKRVLWLVTGGSSIPASADIMEAIPTELTAGLAITLTDERYGEVGHSESNWRQLERAGFIHKEASAVPVLAPELTLEATRQRFEEMITRAFDHADVVIAQFGIGADGHIAGILPHSAAVNASGLVAAYDTPTFTRLTLTFAAIKHVDAAYALVFGNEKQPALKQLRDEDIPLEEQPSQILKQLPEAYVFNDQIGDTS